MNNKKGGFGAKLLLVLILMIASAVGGAYGYRVLDGKLASRDALKAVEDVDISDYDEAEQSVIQGFIDEAKKNLETAKTRKDVYEVIGEFIADVDKVQTSSEKKLEEALKAAEEAKQRYSTNSNNNTNNNSLFGGNDNSQNNDQSFDTNENETNDAGNTGTVNDSNDTNDNSNGYKSNNLNTENETEEEQGGGFLGSLLGGMSSGSGDN